MNIKRLISNRYLTYAVKVRDKRIALTFDDGPHQENTVQILNILKENNAKATFFIVGKKAEKTPELLKLIVRDGHEIANHSYSHANNGNTVQDIEKAERIIRNILGVPTKCVRTPWGKVSFSLLMYSLKNKKKVVLWSFDSQDYRIEDPNTLRDYCKQANIKNGEIILFHEDYQHTLEALPEIIADLKLRGFTFNTVSELLELEQN